MESVSEESLRPLLSMWTKPRATIQQIVDDDPEYLVPVLASIGGGTSGTGFLHPVGYVARVRMARGPSWRRDSRTLHRDGLPILQR